MRALQGSMPIIYDPELNNYLQALFNTIQMANQSQLPPLQLLVINSSAINAFAVPGGVMGINAGLLLYTTDEAELAAVVAHELAHLSQRHFARGIERQERTKWATYAGLLAGLALLATSDSSTGVASILATQAATLDAQLQFSRQNEQEADRVGMDALNRAGFDPRAMPAFFNRLLRSRQFAGSDDFEFLKTHPVTRSRISDSQSRADQLFDGNYLANQSTEFQYMQARITAAYSGEPNTAVRKFMDRFEQQPDNQVNRYGLSRALLRDEQFTKALEHADVLSKLEPNNLTFGLLRVEILIEQEQFATSATAIEQLQQRFPFNQPLRYYQALTQLRLKHYDIAATQFEALLKDSPNNVLYLLKLRYAYGKQHNNVETQITQARLQFSKGKYQQARNHYEQALRLIDRNNLSYRSQVIQSIRDIRRLEQKLERFSS